MIDIPSEKIDEIAKNFYYIIYGEGPLVPRIGVKLRLQRMFGDKYFDLDYMIKLGCEPTKKEAANKLIEPTTCKSCQDDYWFDRDPRHDGETI